MEVPPAPVRRARDANGAIDGKGGEAHRVRGRERGQPEVANPERRRRGHATGAANDARPPVRRAAVRRDRDLHRRDRRPHPNGRRLHQRRTRVTTPLAFADAPEWGDLVGRLFSGDAPADVVPPGIILAADRPEWAVLRRETPWHHSLLATGTAGSVGQIVIQQPSPDRISVVEQILISNDGAAAAGYRLGLFSANTVLGLPTRAATRDLRRLTATTIAQATPPPAPSLTSVENIIIPAGTAALAPIPRRSN